MEVWGRKIEERAGRRRPKEEIGHNRSTDTENETEEEEGWRRTVASRQGDAYTKHKQQ
jgi:hypothetical protein